MKYSNRIALDPAVWLLVAAVAGILGWVLYLAFSSITF